MNCRNAVKLFSEQIEGALDGERAERLRAHLDRCPDCAELIEVMELNTVQLGNVAEPSLPNGLEQRLAAIPRLDRGAAAAGPLTAAGGVGTGGHWLFSNAAAAVILALFITANLTWFNPDFQDSINGCRKMINSKSEQALQLASEWGDGLTDLKRQVESRMDVVRNTGNTSARDTGEPDSDPSGSLVTEIIRGLGLIGA